MQNRRRKEDQNFWNFFFSVLFLIVLVAALWIIFLVRAGTFPNTIPLFDTILMAFAAFRVTRLIVYDKITRWFRELFADTVEFEEAGVVYVEIRAFGSGLRHTIHDLLMCPWCIGFWSALIIVFCYLIFPWAWLVIFFLSLAGMGSLLQLWANSLGWKAESFKLDVREKEARLKEPVDRSSLGS